ncbi:MAG TPA: hypothetical protein ENG40_01810 [Thermoprotei archaeon]|nr:hypothetical protein [Thermoprotei archaeon]
MSIKVYEYRENIATSDIEYERNIDSLERRLLRPRSDIIITISGRLVEEDLFTLISLPETIRESIESLLRELGAPLLEPIKIGYMDGIGLYALATLTCNARQALNYWIKILDRVKEYGVSLFINWTGENDVTPEKLGQYMGKIFAKMNIFPATEKPIDAVKMIEEEWISK